MKKKLFSTLLMCCMVLSCLFILSACGSKGGINEATWKAALNTKDDNKISATISKYDDIIEIKYDGTNYSKTTKAQNSEVPTSEEVWVKDGSNYTVYMLGSNGRYYKKEQTDRDFSSLLNEVRLIYLVDYSSTFKYGDFTYNEASNSFEAKQITFTQESVFDEFKETYYNVKITLENKQVTSISYSDDKGFDHLYTFAYDNFDVTAPNIPVGPIENISAWTSAMDLSGLDNVSMVQRKQNGEIYGEVKWDGTTLCYTTYTHTQIGDIVVGVLVTKEGDNYYRYMDQNQGEWDDRTQIDLDTYNKFIDSYLNLSENYPYADFYYNATTEKYEADIVTQSDGTTTVTIYDVKVGFNNNKVETLTYTYLQETVTMTYSFEDVTITLPGSNE